MATQKPIVSVVFDEETLERIDNFMYSIKVRSRSKAIGELVKMALNDWESDNSTEQLEIYFDPINEMEKLKGILQDMQDKMIKNRTEIDHIHPKGMKTGLDSIPVLTTQEHNKVQIPGRGMRIGKDGK